MSYCSVLIHLAFCCLTALIVAVVKVNAKKHLGDLVKERDSWKGRCQEMAKTIKPVLDVIEPE